MSGTTFRDMMASYHLDGLVQERGNSRVLAMELCLLNN